MIKTDISFISKLLTFWDKLNESEKKLLLDNTELIKYKAGQHIHSAEDSCIGVLLVKSGEIRTYILSDEGKEITLFRLSEGDVCVLSASCIINKITFDVYIDAETDSDIYLISVNVFQQLCNTNIYVENFSNKVLVERFSDVMWAMEQILFMSFDKRLAVFLIDEATKNNNDTLYLTHEQIAKYMGSAREVVSRMLKYFADEGIVELSRGSVKIKDKIKLRNII